MSKEADTAKKAYKDHRTYGDNKVVAREVRSGFLL